jgi:hypothetical protein
MKFKVLGLGLRISGVGRQFRMAADLMRRV